MLGMLSCSIMRSVVVIHVAWHWLLWIYAVLYPNLICCSFANNSQKSILSFELFSSRLNLHVHTHTHMYTHTCTPRSIHVALLHYHRLNAASLFPCINMKWAIPFICACWSHCFWCDSSGSHCLLLTPATPNQRQSERPVHHYHYLLAFPLSLSSFVFLLFVMFGFMLYNLARKSGKHHYYTQHSHNSLMSAELSICSAHIHPHVDTPNKFNGLRATIQATNLFVNWLAGNGFG